MHYYALAFGSSIAVYAVIQFKIAGLEKRKWTYPVLLASFPVYYWVFAIYAADYSALINEIAIGLGFLVIAYLAYRLHDFTGVLLLAFGYIGHGVYDAVHSALFDNRGAPPWWPEFCGSVDVLIGLYLLFLAFSMRRNDAGIE